MPKGPLVEDIKIVGAYPELAEEFKRLVMGMATTSNPNPSLRQIARKVSVNHVTIGNLLKGDRPRVESILRIASAFNVEGDSLLRLAGYDVSSMASNNPQESETLKIEGETAPRVVSAELNKLLKIWDEMSPSKRSVAMKQVIALHEMKPEAETLAYRQEQARGMTVTNRDTDLQRIEKIKTSR